MASTIATKALLKDAETQYHALMTGRSARVVVDQNGERVEFTSARKQDLYAYIQSLQSQLGSGPTALASVAPAGFIF